LTDSHIDTPSIGLGVSPHAKEQVAIDGGMQATSAAASDALDRSFVRGIAWLGTVRWLVQLITWGSTIVVARILSPEDYGLLSMGAVLLAFITLFSDSGIGATVVTARDISSEQIAQLNTAAAVLGVLSFGTACLAAIPVGRFYDQPALPAVIVAASVSMILASFRIIPGALLQRQLRFERLAVISGVQGLIQALTTVVLATMGYRYWSLVLGGVLGALFGTVATVFARPFAFRRPRWETLRPVFPFTRNVLFTRLFWYTYQNSDFIVAGKRLGREALGAYSYAWTLASMPVDKITALVGGVTPPMFAAVQNDIPALRRYFLLVIEGLAVVAFPLTIGIALVAQDLVPVVFGERWRFMTLPLQVLAAYASVRTISPPASQVLQVTGDTRFQMYQNALAAVALPSAFYVGSQWGTVGIALAWTVVHPAVIYLPVHARVFKRLNLSVVAYLRSLWPAVSGCLLMAAAVMLARFLVPTGTSLGVQLAIQILVGAIAYTGFLLLFHRHRVTGFLALWRQRPA
jgi:PST family polysaccharide transporter